jgi:hypothetical protein
MTAAGAAVSTGSTIILVVFMTLGAVSLLYDLMYPLARRLNKLYNDRVYTHALNFRGDTTVGGLSRWCTDFNVTSMYENIYKTRVYDKWSHKYADELVVMGILKFKSEEDLTLFKLTFDERYANR